MYSIIQNYTIMFPSKADWAQNVQSTTKIIVLKKVSINIPPPPLQFLELKKAFWYNDLEITSKPLKGYMWTYLTFKCILKEDKIYDFTSTTNKFPCLNIILILSKNFNLKFDHNEFLKRILVDHWTRIIFWTLLVLEDKIRLF